MVMTERRERVAKRYLNGVRSVTVIAREEGVSAACISKDLAAIREQWRRSAAATYGESLNEQLEALYQLLTDLQLEWERSKKAVVRAKSSVKMQPRQVGPPPQVRPGMPAPPPGPVALAVVEETKESVTEDRIGDPRLAEQIRKVRDDIAKLKGLYKDKIDATITVQGNPNKPVVIDHKLTVPEGFSSWALDERVQWLRQASLGQPLQIEDKGVGT
jgi:hypothetical protein